MDKYRIQNNVYTTLASGINSTTTTITIDKASSPYQNPIEPGNGKIGLLTIIDSQSEPTKIEIIKFTGYIDNGDTLTLTGVERNQEGLGSNSFDSGAVVVQTISRDTFNNLQNNIDNLESDVDFLSGYFDGEISSIENDINYLSGQIDENSNNINTNELNISNNSNDINWLSGEVDDNYSDINWLSGELDSHIHDNDYIIVDNSPTDGSFHAITIIEGTAGEDLSFADVVFSANDNGSHKWYAYEARVDADGHNFARAIVVESGGISLDNSGQFMLEGTIHNSSWSLSGDHDEGSQVYASDELSGGILTTKPSDTDDIVQILGFVLEENIIYFNPDYTTIVVP